MVNKKLLETIKCLDGEVYHLAYHQDRVNRSRKTLGFDTSLTLEITPPKKGLFRCRVVYEEKIEKIEYLPYTAKKIKRFKLVTSELEYALKYEDRTALNNLHDESADEIIIIKNGLVTDTSIANICFYNGEVWLTPKTPLLKGTTRQRLLDENKIQEADIHVDKIGSYKKLALMNAMLDFKIIENAIIS
jgi:4-amino-4-deoxychorismate lyase